MKLFFKTAVVSLNLLLVGNLCCLDCSGASANINPSETIKILPETKFYINKNGGISHNTYILENKTQKLFFKEISANSSRNKAAHSLTHSFIWRENNNGFAVAFVFKKYETGVFITLVAVNLGFCAVNYNGV